MLLLEQLTKSSAFGLPTADSLFVEQKRHEYDALRGQGELTAEQEARMTALREELERLPRPVNDLVDYKREHSALLERIAKQLEHKPRSRKGKTKR